MHFVQIAPSCWICCEHVTAIVVEAVGMQANPPVWVHTIGHTAFRSSHSVEELIERIRKATA